jgi:hypothetical protein
MALSLTVVTPTGFTATNAYHRVEQPVIGIDKTSMSFTLRAYKEVGLQSFAAASFNAPYSVDGDNPFKQAYVYLKSLPDYAGAVDA